MADTHKVTQVPVEAVVTRDVATPVRVSQLFVEVIIDQEAVNQFVSGDPVVETVIMVINSG